MTGFTAANETLSPLILPSHRPTTEVCAPRNDFDLLSQALGNAPILFPPSRGTASDLRQAITALARHRQVSIYVSLSEKIGLPLALLLRARRIKTPHVLVAHHLTSAKKRALQTRCRWLNGVGRIVVLSEPQAEYLRDSAGYPARRIATLPDSVDTAFWRPQETPATEGERFVLSVGQERRDHSTLFASARTLADLPFVVVAGSAWSGQNVRGKNLDPPANVKIRRNLPCAELRDLYARSALVVVPLAAGVLYAAGANSFLETMAMGKPVVLTQTPGLSGYAAPGENVRLVPPENPAALASAIRHLWELPREMSDTGRTYPRAAVVKHGLEAYVAALAGIVRDASAERL